MDWKRGPPVLVGEKVLWSGNTYSKPEYGVIKWIGNIPEKSSDWCVGIELDFSLPSLGGDGFWKERKLFECRSKHGLLVPINEIQKIGSKSHSRTISTENSSHFKLDDSQLGDLTLSDLRHKPRKEIKKASIKNRYSNSESKLIEQTFCTTNNRASDSGSNSKKENRKSIREVFGSLSANQQALKAKNKDAVKSSQDTRKQSERTSNSFSHVEVNDTSEDSQTFDSKAYINELLTMNEIAGYFKEIKEGDERFERQDQTNVVLYDANEQGHSKPKKLFSFLKWFNKKNKQEPNLKLFKDSSSATSSPMFPRRETSSCESIDTLFSTQTVRSFAYIPPTQYQPSAPPLDFDKSFEDITSMRHQSDETESIYDKRKKRKAPEPPRLSRENSLPSTLEHKKNDEGLDGVKTYHRRTVSESFKDKKAGSYCHVQGKRKAPPPPTAQLYPNLQKLNNNQYPSLYKKKKPAPPPPDSNPENQNQSPKEISQPTEELKKEKQKDSKDTEAEQKDEKGMKINQTPKERLTKDASLSPLPSRPWYKRSHRDSTGSNIIRKDLLKGFEKKKNKETDDWMPEVGFPRRSFSSESHSKFNIFSKLEKTEDKKKEEKRKSQISILTNISELDREAAEIVRKEQAEETKKMAENDAKYYSQKEIKDKIYGPTDILTNGSEKSKSKSPIAKIKPNNEKTEIKVSVRNSDRIAEPQAIVDHPGAKDPKSGKDQTAADLKSKEEILKDKENNLNPDSQSNENSKQNSFSPNVLADLTNSSSQSPLSKVSKPSQNPSQARLNFFNVQNKQLNYLNEPWVCQKCTLENPGWRVFCEICSSVKPRFPLNNAGSKPAETEQTPKPQPTKIEKQEELKPAVEKSNETPKPAPEAGDNRENEAKPAESLDELRQKRMTFFSSKSVSQEPDQKEADPTPSESRTKLNKMLKEMRSLSKDGKEEESNKGPNKGSEKPGDEAVKTKSEIVINKMKKDPEKEIVGEQKSNGSIEPPKENHTPAAANDERVKTKPEEVNKVLKREPEKDNVTEQKGKESDAPTNKIANTTVEERKEKTETSTNEQTKNDEKVIEAYVVTKTIVLEDIIVKKPDRGKKVSASVQTKSSISPTSEAKAVKAPPRTKKIAFEPEPESSQQNKNYKQDDLEELTTRLTQAEGLADFRAKIETMPLNTEMNTVAVNRLLRKLEAAINCGDHYVAAGLAKELALMKINCSVTRQVTASPSTSKITIDLYIEDKLSHQGPIPLEVSPMMSLLQLKKKIHQEFGIPLEVQRWILGKKLATDDNTTLESEGVKSDGCPLFLYLVAPDNQKQNQEPPKKLENTEPRQDSPPTQPNAAPKGKGWYYNYEEDHYSYCESSDDDSSAADLSDKAKQVTSKEETKIPETNLKKTEQEVMKTPERNSVFDLKIREAENEAEKELKFINVNSVKQKVEKLNKTFAENANAVKPPFRSSRSPESWKCGACSVLNSPGRLNCLSCNAKKIITGPINTKSNTEKPEQLLKKETPKVVAKPDDNIHYKALVELQDADLVPNSEPFTCSVCLVDYAVGEGVTLKDCLHTFCRPCLIGTVQYSEEAEVKCPYLDETYSCQSVLQQREIKALVPQGIFELHLAKSVKEAENKIGNAFHCKTPDCKGWCIYEDNVNQFRCPVCRSTNCLTCQAIHNGMNCKEYQERMKDASETDVDAKKTRDMLNEMVEKGEAMVCPKCQVVLMKKWGCDWLKCSMCKTEICWVTRGFRWGPEGKGDTSGGCKCGVNGVKCHPKCNYCH